MVHDVQFSGGCLFYLGISLGCHGPWEVECSDVMEHITNTMNVVQHGSYMLNYAYNCSYIYIYTYIYIYNPKMVISDNGE